MSAESGISTFRDKGGLWEGHDVMQVASPTGWQANPELVLQFYNDRRRQLLQVQPNSAHIDLVQLERNYDVNIVTQNVDDLHERAGSSKVTHLHGELLKVRSTVDEHLIYSWQKDLVLGDNCENGHQLRPHIVWFGEMVPMLEKAAEIVMESDIVIIIGTSMQVYPAAGLVSYAPINSEIIYLDPNPFISFELKKRKHKIISKKATQGLPEILEILKI